MVVYASTSRSIYVDGNFLASQSILTPIPSPPSNNFRIGTHISDGSQEFQGSIDDIRLYGRALSPDEIFDLFRENGICGTVSGVWDSTHSPYDITCDVIVPAGDTLRIEPGVRLQFMGPYKFEVQGTLLAEGTRDGFDCVHDRYSRKSRKVERVAVHRFNQLWEQARILRGREWPGVRDMA